MARDEAFSCRVCGHLRHMLACEGRASEASRFVAAIEDSRVEMGGDHDGFHSGIASYSAGVQLYMGSSRPFDEGCSLHSGEHYLLLCKTCRVAYLPDCLFAWCAQEDHI